MKRAVIFCRSTSGKSGESSGEVFMAENITMLSGLEKLAVFIIEKFNLHRLIPSKHSIREFCVDIICTELVLNHICPAHTVLKSVCERTHCAILQIHMYVWYIPRCVSCGIASRY
jgi:hypothetical protein